MKRLPIICIVLVLTLICCSLFTHRVSNANATKKIAGEYTVVIDAGHGGKDAGAIGVDGSNEKTINLQIAECLYDFLRFSGINAVMTRSGDYETYYDENDDKTRSDLYNRMDLVNSIENSVLISIHQNHFEDSAEHGTQIWYSANTAKSKVLADSILQCVKSNLQSDNKRENKESGSSYYLLYKAISPSIMVECGFVSNPEENKLLQNSEYQQKMAYSIFAGTNGVLYGK